MRGRGMADPSDFKFVSQLRNSMSAAGSLGALNLVIRGTRDLPGLKSQSSSSPRDFNFWCGSERCD